MDNKQIDCVAAIVETGSFSLAAEELYISQSSLSKQIIALEKELGVKLFDRSKRKVSLTEAGMIFHKHALNLRKNYRSLQMELGAYKKSIPSLSIAAIPVIAQYGITSYIAKFKEAYPDVNFALEEQEASAIWPALDQNKYDLAFVRDYDFDTKTFSGRAIMSDKLIAAVSCEHRLAKRNSISLSELAKENFIMFKKGTLIHELSMSACRAAGLEPRIFYATLRASSIIGMVASNSGVALIMEKVLNYYKHSDVVAIPLDQTIESKIILAYPKNRKLSKSAHAFLDFMKKQVYQ